MVIFHFCYDLRHFGYVDWDVPNGRNWWPFRYVILTLFIFTMGMSLSLAHGSGIRWKKFAIRLGQMALATLAITAMSLFMFPNAWIYFGILHFLAFASIVGLTFVRVPTMALASGLIILLLYWSDAVGNRWPFDWISGLPVHTEDYVPVFPWLCVALLGVALGRLLPVVSMQGFLCWIPDQMAWLGLAWLGLAWLGRHSLMFYLVLQPILFSGFYLLMFMA